MKYLLLILVCLSSLLPAYAQSEALTVVIIRHGEKNDATDNLSCKGLHRALLLPHVLNSKFKKPSFIYVPSLSTHKSTGHARMFQTVVPFAVQDGLPVNSKYEVNQTSGLAAEILKKTGIVLVVWEHGNIPDIAVALGVKDDHLHWEGKDYDSIWVITYSTSKKGNLKAKRAVDQEGLNPSEACDF
ncbi:histidine phosphatase family protein [Flavitalea flava]